MQTIEQYALSIYEKMPAGLDLLAFIGGGCFRSFYDDTKVKDYDLFFASAADWSLACTWFRQEPGFVELTKAGEETYPCFQRGDEPPFNLIGFRFHKSASTLAASFDFTCCAFAAEMVEPGVVKVEADYRAINDATTKTLRFLNMQHIDRVRKRRKRYVEDYGYTEAVSFLVKLPGCHLVPRSTASGGY